jgi:hypothetical protein
VSLRLFTNLRLADLSLAFAQQRSTGQNLPFDLYLTYIPVAGIGTGVEGEVRREEGVTI